MTNLWRKEMTQNMTDDSMEAALLSIRGDCIMDSYLSVIKKCFDEWNTQGYCEEAVLLNEQIGEKYFDTTNPHFLTGNFASNIVFVMLNPKRKVDEFDKKCNFSNFDEYMDEFMHFGRNKYGIHSIRAHKSQFDHKQVRFLREFGLLPFGDDVYHNLELVIDCKLQLELVPYGSPNFDARIIRNLDLNLFVERLLQTITEQPRRYVFFCGSIFSELLKPYIVQKKEHRFYLPKKDGTCTKRQYSIVNVIIMYQGKEFAACIAPQFTLQGAPLTEYGKKAQALYESFHYSC